MFPLRRVQLGHSRSWDFHRGSIHQPREPNSDALCTLPIDLPAEETCSSLTLGECAFVPFLCPFVARALQGLKGQFESMFLPLNENYYGKQ